MPEGDEGVFEGVAGGEDDGSERGIPEQQDENQEDGGGVFLRELFEPGMEGGDDGEAVEYRYRQDVKYKEHAVDGAADEQELFGAGRAGNFGDDHQ